MEAEDRHGQDEQARAIFLRDALASGAEWARFADPKLLGVLVLLGLGVANLLTHARPLWDAHHSDSEWGWVATIAFVVAAAFAVLSVLFATFGLFPRVTPKRRNMSLFYFGGIATFDTGRAYEAAVRSRTAAELQAELAEQAWEIAVIARHKLRWARNGYFAVVAFLAAWVVARIALSFAG